MSENKDLSLIKNSVLRVSGPHSTSFLQGLITNDIGLLGAQPALYACLLSPQGKFLHDFMISRFEEGYLLTTDASRAQDLLQKIKLYRLRAKVDLELDESWHVGISATQTKDSLCFADPRHASLGYIVFSKENMNTNTSHFNTWDETRIRLGVADGARDADIGLSTLEELNIPKHNGVSFTKGCYVGQELTARLHNRGLGKKHLVAVAFDGVAPPNRPDIFAGDSVIGQLRSVQGTIGLALLKDDYLSYTLTCQGQHLKVLR